MEEKEFSFVTCDGSLITLKATDIKSVSKNGDVSKIFCHEKEYSVSNFEAQRMMELLFKK
jgi:hypothetical protein